MNTEEKIKERRGKIIAIVINEAYSMSTLVDSIENILTFEIREAKIKMLEGLQKSPFPMWRAIEYKISELREQGKEGHENIKESSNGTC